MVGRCGFTSNSKQCTHRNDGRGDTKCYLICLVTRKLPKAKIVTGTIDEHSGSDSEGKHTKKKKPRNPKRCFIDGQLRSTTEIRAWKAAAMKAMGSH